MTKKFKTFFMLVVLTIVIFTLQNGCKIPESVSSKSGAQLWGENCNRCHNAPSPADYSDNQWDALLNHMKVKAGLTNTETNKILEFLKSAN
jgi:cytochrome c1